MNIGALPAKQIAEMIIHNGSIATPDKERPLAQAIAIADGRFLFAGSDNEVMDFKGAGEPKFSKAIPKGFGLCPEEHHFLHDRFFHPR